MTGINGKERPGRPKRPPMRTPGLVSRRDPIARVHSGANTCDRGGQPMKVHECDGHGKVDRCLCEANVQESNYDAMKSPAWVMCYLGSKPGK